MEATSALFMTVGAALLALSWISLIFNAAEEDYAWTLCSVLLPPVAYLYALLRLDKTKDTLLLAVVGWVAIYLSL